MYESSLALCDKRRNTCETASHNVKQPNGTRRFQVNKNSRKSPARSDTPAAARNEKQLTSKPDLGVAGLRIAGLHVWVAQVGVAQLELRISRWLTFRFRVLPLDDFLLLKPQSPPLLGARSVAYHCDLLRHGKSR